MNRVRLMGVWMVCALATLVLAETALVLPGEILPREIPAEFVPDEIVVEFDAILVDVIEAAGAMRQAEQSQAIVIAAEPVPVVGDTDLDALALSLGVIQYRKQFIGADPVLSMQAGLPDLSGYYVVKFDSDWVALDEAVAAFESLPGVLHVEKIGIHPVYATPNDGNYSSQWHLNQSSDRDIDAPEGWNLETGDPAVIVAVLDTGVRYYHKDLGGSNVSTSNPSGTNGNMWINWIEKNGAAGVDDDGNGYVDDWVGWDFVTGLTGCWSGEDCSTADNDPRDFNGHGTHCAGNVGALNNNGYAVASPAGGWGNGTLQATGNGVKVMALRIGYSASYLGQEVGYVRMDFAASAFYYAANNGARIASCSWGSSNSGGLAAAVDYFLASGGLIFKAAGNSNNQTADYMCGRTDVYSVAATSQTDAKASFSSYGAWVDISAPGVSIYSTYHNHSSPANDYVAALSGTSMATPLTASVAASVWSKNPTWTAAQVWTQVRDTAENIDALNPSYAGKLGSGRINLYNAVNTVPECYDDADCDDGNPCNGGEQCVSGNCEPGAIIDCNGNGNDDACDISLGDSLDCNGNNVPDECDIAHGTAEDCNGNAIPDSCDIATGTSADANGNGVPDECEVPGETVLLTFTSAVTIPGVGAVQNEDIVAYDTGSGTWSLYFDGSDVGLGSYAIDALAVLPSGELLISIDADGSLTGLLGGPNGTSVDDSDIIKFTPTSLGATTAGTWTFYFDGSDVGLTTSGEDIDALEVLPDGSLLISTLDAPSVTGLSGLADEDLIRFTPSSLGSVTAGAWSHYFDGSDVGLSTNSNEDVDAACLNAVGHLLLSTLGNFSVPGLAGADEDVFEFSPTSLGATTSGTYAMFLDLSLLGIDTGSDVNAVAMLE